MPTGKETPAKYQQFLFSNTWTRDQNNCHGSYGSMNMMKFSFLAGIILFSGDFLGENMGIPCVISLRESPIVRIVLFYVHFCTNSSFSFLFLFFRGVSWFLWIYEILLSGRNHSVLRRSPWRKHGFPLCHFSEGISIVRMISRRILNHLFKMADQDGYTK